ncbi:RNA binding protein, putative [Candida maltosa Xu316]|uniref:RNA binding protein, putative n=1 Tax=Candida maltosa (strain Xu316) TaxID=1245528 RepID=M3HRY6_CANMX|nr:RNA binding protein, putative [Candida maltosa Xu316]
MSENESDSNNINSDVQTETIVTPPPEVTVSESPTNPPPTLKRKNDDSDDNDGNGNSLGVSEGDSNNLSSIKRVALDSEQLDLIDKEAELQQTAPTINMLPHYEEENDDDENNNNNNNNDNNTQDTLEPAYLPPDENHSDREEPSSTSSSSKPISNHRDKDDPTFVQIRMYCPVKEASTIVGKKGETINHLREKASVRITVSENLQGVPERIVTVKGPAENVARAFGLITRVILEEPEDEPASITSQQYNLKLLIPHPMIGFIIGKQGLKFREIEENSAAKLKAAENALPYSTDRVLSVMGVGDAIHIAVYYISQVLLEHKEALKKNKIVLYNPANYQSADHHHHHQGRMLQNRQHRQPPNNSYNNPMAYQPKLSPFNKPPQPHQQSQQGGYNFSMMFQPAIQPQHFGSPMTSNPNHMPVGGSGGPGGGGSMQPSISIPPQNQYTDEYGNTIIGEVITNPPVQAAPDKYNQDVYVANSSIGSVIGKGGNNIKHIRETSACTYVKIEPDKGQSIMLGGGKGMTNIRKLTLTGSLNSIQTAIYLINQRINADRERNSH